MRENLVVGILKERSEKGEKRAPLTPLDVRRLVKKGIEVEVESSETRVFSDGEYKKTGAAVLDKFKRAVLLLGIKEPKLGTVYKDKIYMVFSHTIKGQPGNMLLLKEFIEKGVTLIDYEKITDSDDRRLVYFGKFAGICGLIDSLYYLGRKLQWQGIRNPFQSLRPAYHYGSLKEIIRLMPRISKKIKRQGFDRKISPFIIGITGHGNVSGGIQKILKFLNPVEIRPGEIEYLVARPAKTVDKNIYKVVFPRGKRYRYKDGREFSSERYLREPKKFESNMDIYLPYLNLLIQASYWDSRYPRLVTKTMINRLSGEKRFRLKFIGDISCDLNGGIELTYKAAVPENPVFTYNPGKKKFVDGYKEDGITILAIDNLPAELPGDSSREFGGLIGDYVYQIAARGAKDITKDAVLPKEIRQAVITQGGGLTSGFSYLKRELV
ncbi:MAG: hypothetical protein U9Q24_02355 [Candidatus Ratteibacteria bacterium]|nr:hypothetical protein [Candidatus Ratteibacteria bacterium]